MVKKKTLPSPKEIKNLLPLPETSKSFILKSRKSAESILSGESRRIAIITGPCSIHNMESAISYAKKMKNLISKVEDRCFLVMRAYVEKPRTELGWKGFLYDPDVNGSNDLLKGLLETRKLFLALSKLQIPLAVEILDPLAFYYYEDLISWGFVGARTVASQIHRQIGSGVSFPIGFKNSVEGCIDSALQAVSVSKTPHSFFGIDETGRFSSQQSSGNFFSHVVLRGSDEGPNYDKDTLKSTIEKLRALGLLEKLMIDCAHGNCEKNLKKQKEAFLTILELVQEREFPIFGLMLESFIKAGSMPMENLHLEKEISITDPCLDWETTESLILWAYHMLTDIINSPYAK